MLIRFHSTKGAFKRPILMVISLFLHLYKAGMSLLTYNNIVSLYIKLQHHLNIDFTCKTNRNFYPCEELIEHEHFGSLSLNKRYIVYEKMSAINSISVSFNCTCNASTLFSTCSFRFAPGMTTSIASLRKYHCRTI